MGLSSVTLGANRTLSVVRFGEKTLLVGSTAQSIALLATEDSAGGRTDQAVPRSVAEMLADDDEDFSFEGDAQEEVSFNETLAAAEENLLADFRAPERSKRL
jgi:flagellar biogenesis protein FliO